MAASSLRVQVSVSFLFSFDNNVQTDCVRAGIVQYSGRRIADLVLEPVSRSDRTIVYPGPRGFS